VTTFVDTTALYALLAEDDLHSQRAQGWLSGAGSDPAEILITHNYVLVETVALMHRRLGIGAVRRLFAIYVPGMSIRYVDEHVHARATSSYLASGSEPYSFVDRVSFEVMRERRIARAFCFDRDFAREGFETVP
jgi:predicted nucleic acid-binding protein